MRTLILAAFSLLSGAAAARAQGPFGVEARLERPAGAPARLSVTLSVPPNHYLYAGQTAVEAQAGVRLAPTNMPAAARKLDPFLQSEVPVYDRDVTLVYAVHGLAAGRPLSIEVRYQGCSDSLCFMPVRRALTVGTADEPEPPLPQPEPPPAAVAGWREAVSGFRIGGTAAGYLPVGDFLAFIERAESGAADGGGALARALEGHGIWLVLLLILAGGLALNLTPCVLPMIPVNLAIIGAGAQAGSRRRGFALGGAYGLGIALVYGLLGLGVILTGARFGTLNSSPWFNASVAALFFLLALAMFDVLTIDLSRFQSGAGVSGKKRGGFLAALVLGGVAALLAGACVAPVVISVLLLATDLYSRGRAAGLLLPFVLGLGMALPWPFAGAGLSFLPRPGAWMTRVKQVFGVMILLFALYYGRLAFGLWRDRPAAEPAPPASSAEAVRAEGQWHTSLAEALAEGRRRERPVFIDFWATWCKNCIKMDKTTFKDPAVVERLADYVKVKVQAENIGAPDTKAMLDQFGAVGLPTYVVLQPRPIENAAEDAPRP